MYNTTNALFTLPEGNDKKEFSFNDLFKGNATELLQGFMKKLEVKSEEEKAGSGNNDKKEAPEE